MVPTVSQLVQVNILAQLHALGLDFQDLLAALAVRDADVQLCHQQQREGMREREAQAQGRRGEEGGRETEEEDLDQSGQIGAGRARCCWGG